MRASLLAVAAAAVLVAGVPSAPGLAQGVSVEVPGVGVRIGDPERDRRARRERREYRERTTVGGEGCRETTVRTRMPDGSVVTRRRSSC
jgi:hypothetical protein